MCSDREGVIFKNNQCCLIKVIEYVNCEKVLVEFQDDFRYKKYTSWHNLIKGKIKNPYYKSVYGVGYLGVGKYKSRENYKITKEYKTWQSMLQRCYDKKHLERDNSYIGCTVDEEWHNFQNFAEWYNENYYEIEGKKICLDKDIKFKNNKIYSKDKCSLIPEDINLIFATHKATRNGTPIGVVYDKNRGKYMAHMVIDGNFKNLGYFNDYKNAFYIYKKSKENYIKSKAKLYKEYLDEETYKSLINWKIEISD